MTLQELQESRAAKLAEMRTINDSGEMDDSKRTAFDKLEKEVETLNADITRRKRFDELERVAQNGTPVAGTTDFRAEASKYSLTRAIAHASGFSVDAAREIEVSQEIANQRGDKPQGIFAPDTVFNTEKRVVTATGSGSGLIFEEARPEAYIDILRSRLVTSRMGATVLTGLTGGTISIPKLAASAGSEWIADNGALTAADETFEQVNMTAKTIGALSEYSRLMLLQSSPDIEQLVRRDFAASLAVGLDKAALNGDGNNNEPLGIIPRVSASPMLDSLSEPTWIQVLAMVARLQLNNVDETSLGWVLNPRAVQTLRATPKLEFGSPVTDAFGGYIMEDPNSLAGYRAVSSTLVETSVGSPNPGAAIFGDWSSLLIGMWSGIDILANPYESTAYSKGNTQVRALMTADINLRGADRFAAATDVPLVS